MRTRRHRAIMWAEQGRKRKGYSVHGTATKMINVEVVSNSLRRGVSNFVKEARKVFMKIRGVYR